MGRERRYVIQCESGTEWLVVAASERDALDEWAALVEIWSAEPAMSASAASRADIVRLRELGSADSDA